MSDAAFKPAPFPVTDMIYVYEVDEGRRLCVGIGANRNAAIASAARTMTHTFCQPTTAAQVRAAIAAGDLIVSGAENV